MDKLKLEEKTRKTLSKGEIIGDKKAIEETNESNKVVLRPSESEFQAKFFHLAYYTAEDYYTRPVMGDDKFHGWEFFMYSSKSIFRHEEIDRQMAYLARTRIGPEIGEIAWMIHLEHSKLKPKELRIHVDFCTFGSATIKALLSLNDKDRQLCWGIVKP